MLARNTSVLPSTIRYLKTEDGMGVGIETLINSIVGMFTGGPPPVIDDFGDTTFTFYYNRYGALPGFFDDENNLSMVTFITCGHHKIIFPGDMEKAGWLQLLRDPNFVRELHSVNLFVASHHGRENGYCEEVLNLCSQIRAVIISDKKKGHQTQETVDRYRAYASGFQYGTENPPRAHDAARFLHAVPIAAVRHGHGLSRPCRRMNRTFDFYEYAGVIIPGAVLMVGLLLFFPEGRALFTKDGVTFGEVSALRGRRLRCRPARARRRQLRRMALVEAVGRHAEQARARRPLPHRRAAQAAH